MKHCLELTMMSSVLMAHVRLCMSYSLGISSVVSVFAITFLSFCFDTFQIPVDIRVLQSSLKGEELSLN